MSQINPTLLRSPIWRWLIYAALFGYAVWQLVPLARSHGPSNGFDLSASLIPVRAIEQGGPPRDGIPAIDHPQFLAASKVDYLAPEDRILGLNYAGAVKAYPVKILNYHEIVNDTAGTKPVLVSFCPLCGTGMAFSASVAGKTLQFGVSGLLYNSDVLLYDRETESLWSQLMTKAVTGRLSGKRLTQIPLQHTTWADWRAKHPHTLVLSRNTGVFRDYSRSPYAGYADSDSVWFDVAHHDSRYRPKELVLGLVIHGVARAYPFVELGRSGKHAFADVLAGVDLRVEFDAANRTGRIFDRNGTLLPTTISFWFAWVAFHPDTLVYVADAQSDPSGKH